MTRALRSVAAMNAGSEFESVFLEHYSRVFGILTRLTGNPARADELANEVFFRLSQKPESWLLANNVSAWLYRAATYAGIDSIRAANHRARNEAAAALDPRTQETAPALPLTELLRQEDRRKVRSVLSRMKPAQARVLLLRAEGFSYKEMAEALKVAVSGVGTLLNRAEAEFRKRYLRSIGKKEIR